MSKKDYTIDSKVVNKVAKDAEKVRKIQEQIEALQNKLTEIKDDNSWINYASWSTEDFKDSPHAESFGENLDTIKYSTR